MRLRDTLIGLLRVNPKDPRAWERLQWLILAGVLLMPLFSWIASDVIVGPQGILLTVIFYLAFWTLAATVLLSHRRRRGHMIRMGSAHAGGEPSGRSGDEPASEDR